MLGSVTGPGFLSGLVCSFELVTSARCVTDLLRAAPAASLAGVFVDYVSRTDHANEQAGTVHFASLDRVGQRCQPVTGRSPGLPYWGFGAASNCNWFDGKCFALQCRALEIVGTELASL